MEPDAGGHQLVAVADGEGILVSCTCGWQVWSRTSPSETMLRLAETRIGGQHLANVNVPTPPRRDVLIAVGLFGLMVLATVVAVFLIATT